MNGDGNINRNFEITRGNIRRQRESLFNTNGNNMKQTLTKEVSNSLLRESTVYDIGSSNRKNLEKILTKI
jgi:hypothetical protein